MALKLSSPARQRGITLIGWVCLLVPVAIVVYAGIRLAPIYLNYMKVVHTLDGLSGEFHSGGGGANLKTIRDAIERRFEIESVDYPAVKDIEITRNGAAWQVKAAYDDQAPLFANITILVSFDKIVTVGSD